MYYRLCSRSIIYDFDDSEPDPETDDHLVSNCFLLYSGEPSSCANKKTPDHLRICPCTNQGKSHCMCIASISLLLDGTDRPSAAPSNAAPSSPTASPSAAPSDPTETPTEEPSFKPQSYPTTAPDSCTKGRPGNACTGSLIFIIFVKCIFHLLLSPVLLLLLLYYDAMR